MAGILFQITSVFFFVWLLSSALHYLRLFQEKEYDAKRVFIHLLETRRGRSILMGKVTITKWIIIFLYGATIFSAGFDLYYHIVVSLFYFGLFLLFFKRILSREIVFPKFSKVALLVLALSIGTEFLLFAFAPIDRFLWIVVIDKLLLVFITLYLTLFSIFFDFSEDLEVNRAIKKLARHPKLFSIAVVGSYGRGSTKEFISQILSLRYNVFATRTSFASPVKIAKTINLDLSQKKQIFIAEIDDYKKEDVRDICTIIKPKIVVVSGINEQKLSVFGSMEKIIDSKLEAVSSLSRDGIALLYGNGNYAKKLIGATKNKKFIYGFLDDSLLPDIVANNIKERKFCVSFIVSLFGKNYKLSGVKLLGRQNIENLIPAIFIGVYAGIDFSLIRRAVLQFRPLPGAMEPRRHANGAILINDTYNANINSVARALSYTKLYRGKKILVLEPLVELGKTAESVHRELGRIIGEVCDLLFLTNDNYLKFLKIGILKSGRNCKIKVAAPAEIINFVNKNTKGEDIIVFEGNEAEHSFSSIASESVY